MKNFKLVILLFTFIFSLSLYAVEGDWVTQPVYSRYNVGDFTQEFWSFGANELTREYQLNDDMGIYYSGKLTYKIVFKDSARLILRKSKMVETAIRAYGSQNPLGLVTETVITNSPLVEFQITMLDDEKILVKNLSTLEETVLFK